MERKMRGLAEDICNVKRVWLLEERNDFYESDGLVEGVKGRKRPGSDLNPNVTRGDHLERIIIRHRISNTTNYLD